MDIPASVIYAVIALIIGVIAFFLVKKKFVVKKHISGGVDYIKKGDPDAQTIYDNKFKNPNPLTKDEKIELSWEFLYEITDTVLAKFSSDDKEQVTKIGHQMLDAGAGYEHVIEYGLKPEKKRSHLIEEEQERSQDVELKR